MYYFAESIHKDKYAGTSLFIQWKTNDEVHAYRHHDSATIRRCRNGACEESVGFMRWHVLIECTHFWMYLCMRGHKSARDMATNVFTRPRRPPDGLS